MKRSEEIKNICLSVLSKQGIGDESVKECAEEITAEIVGSGYVKFDSIKLDPQKSVQLLATILNGFRAEHPFVVVETDEDTLQDSKGDGPVVT